MELAETVASSEGVDGLLLVGGFVLNLYLLAVAGYNLQGTFMRPGSLRQRVGRFLIAIGAMCAIGFIVIHTVKKGE